MKGMHCALQGGLGQDVDLRRSQSGKDWCRLSVGVGEGDEVTWVSAAVFEDKARVLAGLKTTHARRRALERRIPVEVLLDIVETGTQRERDPGHCWIWKVIEGREDNPLCVAVLVADTVIIKTVMHYFDPEANRCM